jgi:protease I
MKFALLIIAQKGFQDFELDGTRQGLLDAGFTVVLASSEVGECVGKFGGKETAAIALRDVHVGDCDRIGFIGGPGAEALKDDIYAKAIAKDAFEAGMPLGAICIAPLILAAAGILTGKRATCFVGDGRGPRFLADRGAKYLHEDVVVDGNIVTANGPEAAEEFGKMLAAIMP